PVHCRKMHLLARPLIPDQRPPPAMLLFIEITRMERPGVIAAQHAALLKHQHPHGRTPPAQLPVQQSVGKSATDEDQIGINRHGGPPIFSSRRGQPRSTPPRALHHQNCGPPPPAASNAPETSSR